MRSVAILHFCVGAASATSEASLDGTIRRKGPQPDTLPLPELVQLPVCGANALSPACLLSLGRSCQFNATEAGCCSRYEWGVKHSDGEGSGPRLVADPTECATLCAAEGAPGFTFGIKPPIYQLCRCKDQMQPREVDDSRLMSGRTCAYRMFGTTIGRELLVHIKSSRGTFLDAGASNHDGRWVHLSPFPMDPNQRVWKRVPRLDDNGEIFCHIVVTYVHQRAMRLLLSDDGRGGVGIWYDDDNTGAQRWEVLPLQGQSTLGWPRFASLFFVRAPSSCPEGYVFWAHIDGGLVCRWDGDDSYVIRSRLGGYLDAPSFNALRMWPHHPHMDLLWELSSL